MSPILANKEVYGLIRDGIPVQYENAKGKAEHGIVKVVDFNNIESEWNTYGFPKGHTNIAQYKQAMIRNLVCSSESVVVVGGGVEEIEYLGRVGFNTC